MFAQLSWPATLLVIAGSIGFMLFASWALTRISRGSLLKTFIIASVAAAMIAVGLLIVLAVLSRR
jgi:NADH:ubiquinone oxidoreductase subunit K